MPSGKKRLLSAALSDAELLATFLRTARRLALFQAA